VKSRHHLGEAFGSVELEALICVLAPDPGARAANGRDPRSPATLATHDTGLPWVAERTEERDNAGSLRVVARFAVAQLVALIIPCAGTWPQEAAPLRYDGSSWLAPFYGLTELNGPGEQRAGPGQPA
jgi:hypothetical protein